MFTIEVKKREKEEEFNFKDLLKSVNIVHDDCYRGKANMRWVESDDLAYWFFGCKRCDTSTRIIEINEKKEMKLKIVLTALDGKERQIDDNIRVIQRT